MSSSADKLVFDLSSEIESSTNVFVKKDWINILDNMNTNYASNQSVIDTSQLSNSNKYMSYREAYLIMPILLTVSTSTLATAAGFAPGTPATTADYMIGLKSWYGQLIHSFTLDYQGTTVIQQTPYINMYNSFRLLTSMSWQDVISQGPTIGFYPDDPLAFSFYAAASVSGMGTCNNMINPLGYIASSDITVAFNSYNRSAGNIGALKRCQYINYHPDITTNGAAVGDVQYTALQTSNNCTNLWKSYIYSTINGVNNTNQGSFQIAITATIYLKHIHSFFAMCPLLKGVFLKMTMNLNNTSVNFSSAGAAGAMTLTSVSNAVGGCCPLLLSAAQISVSLSNAGAVTYAPFTHLGATSYIASVSVGSQCLNTSQSSIQAPGPRSIYLYVPAYTFNPVFEQAYLSSPIKQICYTDVYQYQVIGIAGGGGGQFNNLLTNGIANIKSVLIIPFYSATTANTTGLPAGIPVFQSPFDTAGSGTTSPLCAFSNFNIVVSGQNAIYNTQMRGYEQFNNQLYGTNAVNGGLTDGLTSGLISASGFESSYCYYYVDVGRMLPVEESVPKSVQIIGTSQSAKAIDLYCFISYQQTISIDILTGSRV